MLLENCGLTELGSVLMQSLVKLMTAACLQGVMTNLTLSRDSNSFEYGGSLAWCKILKWKERQTPPLSVLQNLLS